MRRHAVTWNTAIAVAAVIAALAPVTSASAGARARAAAGTAMGFAGGPGGPGPGTSVALTAPCGVVSTGGRTYFADAGPSGKNQIGSVIRELDPRTGRLTNVAGTGVLGSSGNGGPADSADLDLHGPCALTADHAGNLIFGSQVKYRYKVQMIAARDGTFYGIRMLRGHIYAIASLDFPAAGLAVDYAGNLVISVEGPSYVHATVQVLTASSGAFYGRAMQAGRLYQVYKVRRFTSIGPETTDPAGNPMISGPELFVLAARSGTFDGRAMVAGHAYVITARLSGAVSAVTRDRFGNLVAVDGAALKVLAARTGRFYGRSMVAGQAYRLTARFPGYRGDGGPVGDARIQAASGIAIDGYGNIVIGDTYNRRVRVVAATSGRFYGIAMRAGYIYTVAGDGSLYSDSGDGGPATSAELSTAFPGSPQQNNTQFSGVATDTDGNAYLADANNDRIRMVPAVTGSFFGQPMRAGRIYTIAGSGVGGFSGDGGPATSAELWWPFGVTADRHGNVLFADWINGRVRVIAARSGTFYGQQMTIGDIYTIVGGGTMEPGDGVAGTALAISPGGLAVDGAGNVLITVGYSQSDEACTFAGRVLVLAASTGTFYGQPMTAGDTYTIAGGLTPGGDGGPATSAEIAGACGVAVDASGNVVVAGTYEQDVRVIAAKSGTFYGQSMTAGDIYTVAGGGTSLANGIPAVGALVRHPEGVAVDAAGNLVVACAYRGNVLRVVAVRSGRFYGRQMTAGDIYTIAGGGYGIVPGGRLATAVSLLTPEAVAVEPNGDLLVSEPRAGRVIVVRG
jgi:hypothetical protein